MTIPEASSCLRLQKIAGSVSPSRVDSFKRTITGQSFIDSPLLHTQSSHLVEKLCLLDYLLFPLVL
jgi:hypothetical protein